MAIKNGGMSSPGTTVEALLFAHLAHDPVNGLRGGGIMVFQRRNGNQSVKNGRATQAAGASPDNLTTLVTGALGSFC